MDVRPFDPADLLRLELQLMQRDNLHITKPGYGASLMTGDSLGWTAWAGDRVLACAGLQHAYAETMVAWAFLADGLGPAMVGITRTARHALQQCPRRRIEAMTPPDWPAANRWLAMLGFEKRALLRFWGPDATDVNYWELIQ